MNEKKQQAILLMAEGKMCQEVAEEIGVTPKTISQWRSDPEFRTSLNKHLHDIQTTHSKKLCNLQGLALKTIEDCLSDPELPAKTRLAAAFKTLEIERISVKEPVTTYSVEIAHAGFNEELNRI